MTSRPTGRARRGRVVGVVLALGVLALLLSALPWARATVPTVLTDVEVSVSGAQAAPAVGATGLAVLASGLAVAIGGRWAVRLGAVALVLSAVLLTTSTVGFLLEPDPAVLAAAADASGVRDIAGSPALTPWPFLTAALGLLVAGGAVLVLRTGRDVASARRFERPATGTGSDAAGPAAPGAAPDARVQAMDDWDALGRGEDPTAAEHG